MGICLGSLVEVVHIDGGDEERKRSDSQGKGIIIMRVGQTYLDS